MATLRLGVTDAGRRPERLETFLSAFHETGMRARFRREKNDTWTSLRTLPGAEVEAVQRTLVASGFLPAASATGIFDYRTQSAVRLFQETVRTVEGHADIGKPDGIVGRLTRVHLERWAEDGTRVDWRSHRVPADPWFRLLDAYRDHTLAAPGPLQQLVMRRFEEPVRPDTLPASVWDASRDHIHLIGIRRGATADWKIKLNNDVFILLAGGGVFTFFGSTDPNPKMTSRPPFLLPGQHLYRFGWHKISQPEKCYRAFRPRAAGVLVMRDRDNRRATVNLKDERILASAVDASPNPTINIHWSGRHTSSWSAGCQVISGGGYINHHDVLVDCWEHASAGYVGLGKGTRGAYNVLLDLITTLSPDPRVVGGDPLRYTLINEHDLDLEPSLGRGVVRAALLRGMEILERHDPPKAKQYRLHFEA